MSEAGVESTASERLARRRRKLPWTQRVEYQMLLREAETLIAK